MCLAMWIPGEEDRDGDCGPGSREDRHERQGEDEGGPSSIRAADGKGSQLMTRRAWEQQEPPL